MSKESERVEYLVDYVSKLQLARDYEKLEQEIEKLNKELNTYKYRPKTRFRDVIELRDRINKAIEYIENCSGIYKNALGKKKKLVSSQNVLDILKGIELTENDKKQIKWLSEEFKVGVDKE